MLAFFPPRRCGSNQRRQGEGERRGANDTWLPVKPEDKVTFEGKAMKPQVKKVYILLTKPKGYITTTDDEQDRRTVMELVQLLRPSVSTLLAASTATRLVCC
jgi:16S rRNA U516 pseudouridylate synthase RsuA-like enzyme